MKKDFVSGLVSGAGKAIGTAIVLWLLSLLPPVREKVVPWLAAFAKEGSGKLVLFFAAMWLVFCFVAFHYFRKHRALVERVRMNKLTIGDMMSLEDMRKALDDAEGKLGKKGYQSVQPTPGSVTPRAIE